VLSPRPSSPRSIVGTSPGLREAIEDLSKGRAGDGFDKLGKFGVIQEIANDNARGVQEKRFKSGEQWEVLRWQEGAVIVGKNGVEKQLPLDQTRKFSVFEREKITLSIGDRIRFTKNVKHRGKKFLNNELRTVVSIDEGKIYSIKARLFALGPFCISTRE
jgi:hypothetical protein